MNSLAGEKNSDQFGERRYDTNLITGALLWPDTKKLAVLLLSGATPIQIEDLAQIKNLVIKDNIFERQSKKTSLNILSYLLRRLSASPASLIALIATGNSTLSKQAAFLASLQSSRFLREFFSTVVCDRLDSFSPYLPPLFWEDFWSSCISHEPSLLYARSKAVSEIRSVLLKFLVEIEVLESSRSTELKQIVLHPDILPVLKSPEISWLIPSVRSFVR